MANIKDLKKRIKSTKGTYKITSAMKLVSAAKLAKAQSKIQGFRPYSFELSNTVKTVSALASEYSHEYFDVNNKNKQTLLLVVSSDKGLCGGYNSQLTKAVRKFIGEHSELEFKVSYIGKKVRDIISEEVNSGDTHTFEKLDPTYDEVKDIAEDMASLFSLGEYGRVFVAYNSFQSAIAFESKVTQFLPMSVPESEKVELKEKFPYDFKYDPSADSILDSLVPEVLNTTLFTYVLDAIASEHGSRMSAMENASKNCKDMIKKLTLKMNKLRQAAITTELIEVVSGAESLKS